MSYEALEQNLQLLPIASDESFIEANSETNQTATETIAAPGSSTDLLHQYEVDVFKYFGTSSEADTSLEENESVNSVIREDAFRPLAAESNNSRLKRIYAGALAGAALTSLAFEKSPLNEALRVAAGTEVLERTESALAVGGTVAAITLAIEGVSSGLIAAGLHNERGLVRKIKDKYKDKFTKTDPVELGKEEASESKVVKKASKALDSAGDMGIALGVGAGLVVVKRHLKESEPTLKKDIKTAIGASAVVAAFSGGVGYLAGGGITYAEKLGLGTPAEYFVDYATDTKFWMALVGTGYLMKWMNGVRKRAKAHKRAEADVAKDQPSSSELMEATEQEQ